MLDCFVVVCCYLVTVPTSSGECKYIYILWLLTVNTKHHFNKDIKQSLLKRQEGSSKHVRIYWYDKIKWSYIKHRGKYEREKNSILQFGITSANSTFSTMDSDHNSLLYWPTTFANSIKIQCEVYQLTVLHQSSHKQH